MRDQVTPGHNRWNRDIPPATARRPGRTYRIECKDWTDNQGRNDDSADDIRDMNIDPCHMLSGPFAIEGLEPGDLLVVDIVNIGPFQAWVGCTGVFAGKRRWVPDRLASASKAIWDLDGVWASSRHVPGVRFIGDSHPGLFGCAPSSQLLAEWNRREQALIDLKPRSGPRRSAGQRRQRGRYASGPGTCPATAGQGRIPRHTQRFSVRKGCR